MSFDSLKLLDGNGGGELASHTCSIWYRSDEFRGRYNNVSSQSCSSNHSSTILVLWNGQLFCHCRVWWNQVRCWIICAERCNPKQLCLNQICQSLYCLMPRPHAPPCLVARASSKAACAQDCTVLLYRMVIQAAPQPSKIATGDTHYNVTAILL